MAKPSSLCGKAKGSEKEEEGRRRSTLYESEILGWMETDNTAYPAFSLGVANGSLELYIGILG